MLRKLRNLIPGREFSAYIECDLGLILGSASH